VSVILDALRRRRRESTPSESATRGIPAGLGLASAVSDVSRQNDRRLRLIALAIPVVLLGIWLDLRFNASDVSPAAQGPKPEAQSPKPEARIPNPEPRIPNPESRAPNPAPRIPNPAPRTDHFALALRFQNLGDFARAREHYQAVLAADEFNVEARNNLGLLYHGRGMASDAIEQFKRAIQINPQYTRGRSNLAVVLTGAGRLAEARAELRTALEIDPRNPDLLVNLALVEKADRHSEQAVELLLQALGKSPAHAAAHYNLAVLYDERDSPGLAFDHYNAFLKYAGPEHGARLTEVQGRVRAIETRLQRATN
jgi:tetratricopeptide (TPR) repeat protein